ncbi:hypothetical protein P3454_26180, partial [Vibrio parahaemolyticus]|nr:hypothetical protein [Vibrio parahaemolyticus]
KKKKKNNKKNPFKKQLTVEALSRACQTDRQQYSHDIITLNLRKEGEDVGQSVVSPPDNQRSPPSDSLGTLLSKVCLTHRRKRPAIKQRLLHF